MHRDAVQFGVTGLLVTGGHYSDRDAATHQRTGQCAEGGTGAVA
jgi:hypothetical protein